MDHATSDCPRQPCPKSLIAPLLSALCFLGLFRNPALAQSTELKPRSDNQVWGELLATHTLRRDMDYAFSGGLRLGRDASHLVYERVGSALVFKLGESSGWRKYVTISPQYNYLATQPFSGEEAREHRVSLETMARIPLGRWTASLRTAFDRRFIDPKDTTRCRNRLLLERPIHVAHRTLQGFASDEVYYEWRYHAWSRNRFIIGAGKSLNERVSLDIYYVKQDDGFARPGDLNAIGFTLRTRF